MSGCYGGLVLRTDRGCNTGWNGMVRVKVVMAARAPSTRHQGGPRSGIFSLFVFDTEGDKGNVWGLPCVA
jgi:hypothetical protein